MTANGQLQVRPEASVPVDTETTAMLRMIQQAASDPNVDIVKLERLFEMREKIEDRRERQAFNAAMAAAQAELIPVARNAYNPQTRAKYADLSAISEMALPIIHKHGLALSFSEFRSEIEGCAGIACEVMHSDGYAKSFQFNVPMDGTGLKGNANKTATHAYGSTATYGRRYATLAVFNIIIAAKDDDGNGGRQSAPAPEFISEAQIAELQALITETSTDIDRFLKIGNVESLSDITTADFPKAKAVLLERKVKQAEKAKGGAQ